MRGLPYRSPGRSRSRSRAWLGASLRPVDQALIGNPADGDGSDIGAVEVVPELIIKDSFE